MALRNIVQDGDPILKKKCRPVTKFDDRLQTLVGDMAETMLDANGLGLAGPQVGVMRRVFVMLDERDAPGEDASEEEWEAYEPKVLALINPELLQTEGEVRGYEGCLSFPGRFGAIARPERVTVRAFDAEGNPFTLEAEGMMARCICHENNHLDGITIDDLAEYFYDPEDPHDLDEELEGASPDPDENTGD